MTEMVEINAELIHETELAWLIDDDGKRHWLPKSKCTYDGRTSFEVPDWMCTEKGLA